MVEFKVEVETLIPAKNRTISQQLYLKHKIYYMLINKQTFRMSQQEDNKPCMNAQNARVQFRGEMYPF